VKHVSDRYTIKKDDLLKRGLTAAALALIISPALAFLPFIQGNDLAARDMRVEDRQRPGRQVAVQILGDMLGSITLGDAIAIWGQVQQGGLVIMQSAYNYTTDSEVRLKK
jgi:hypothetical protein